jgi:pimeloyl-ACP methyl ester carboxylesterase
LGVTHRGIALLLALLTAATLAATAADFTREASAQAAPAELPASVYIPSIGGSRGPLKVVLAVHGMGDSGPSFGSTLTALAEKQGWALVAPTMPYGDWRDPDVVRSDESQLLPRLKATIDRLPARTGLKFQDRVMCYGFSRGAQICQRYALAYPQSVLIDASLSAGTYTLPYAQAMVGDSYTTLRFPYGVSDLDQVTGRSIDYSSVRAINYLIGVGEKDNNPADVPRQWDQFIGTNRVDRAANYAHALQSIGARCTFVIFPGIGHEQTDDVRKRSFDFMASVAG